jgi:aerobic carbon-monoxide dehydrogenase small subunit
MGSQKISLKVNGVDHELMVDPRLLLVHCLRDVLGLTGTHIGCETSHCGACTVHLDGKAIKSCSLFAVQGDGREITTVEGLEQNGTLHPIQEGFWQEHGLQCGFCTPGVMMTATAFLNDHPHPSEDEIRMAISGNLCRCTGYTNIVKSIQYAAAKLRQGE